METFFMSSFLLKKGYVFSSRLPFPDASEKEKPRDSLLLARFLCREGVDETGTLEA